jgi:hypothetical protein
MWPGSLESVTHWSLPQASRRLIADVIARDILNWATKPWDSAHGVAEGRSICEHAVGSVVTRLANASPLQDCANLGWFALVKSGVAYAQKGLLRSSRSLTH